MVKVSLELNNKLKQAYHFRHYLYTQVAYRIGWLPPHRYVFVLTNQCNLSCRHCYQDTSYKKETMTAKQWVELSQKLPKFSMVTLTGGEPLLHPGFREVFADVAKRYPCNLITNGSLLTEELVDLMLSYPKFKILAISIDGLKDDMMNIRGFTEKQWGNLKRIINYFVHRRDEMRSRCLLDIKTLILDENAHNLFEIHKYCIEKLKANTHDMAFLKGSPLQHSDRAFRLEQIFEEYSAPTYKNFDVIVGQIEKIRHYDRQNGVLGFFHMKIPDSDFSFINNNNFDPDKFKPCKFPWSSVHVNFDGEIFPCLSVPMGNVKEKSLKEIFSGKAYKDLLSIIREKGVVPACNRCGWLILK